MGGNPSVHFTTFFVLPLLCELRLNCGHIYLHGKMPSSSLFVEYRKDHRNLLIFTLYQYQYSRYCVNVRGVLGKFPDWLCINKMVTFISEKIVQFVDKHVLLR